MPYGIKPELWDEVVARYEGGESTIKLAVAFGTGFTAVRTVLKSRGVERRHGWAKDPGAEKKCPKCQKVLPIGAFSKVSRNPKAGTRQGRGTHARAGYCRPCATAVSRPLNFVRRTGLTIEQYEVLKQKQRGRCALCQKVPKKLNVDHDHATGVVRGLLCHGCNILMRGFDDKAWQARAAQYATQDTGYRWPDSS